MIIRNDLTKSTVERTIEAIEAGKKDDAKELAKLIWEETRPVHDMYGDLTASLFTFIAKKYGEEAVEEAHRYYGEEIWKPILLSMKDKGVAALINVYAFFMRTHGFDFYCEEDGEKYVFVSKYCPSGGRMMKEGKNDNSDRHPFQFGTTKKAYPWSFHKKGISYYCSHCSLWMDMLPREWGWDIFEFKFGRQFDEEGKPIDEPCRTIIYKTPRS